MNKRDFLVHGGGVLLSGATMGAAWAARAPANATPYEGATPAATQLARWQALQGLRFGCHTTLGRPVALILSDVIESTHAASHTGIEQFTLSFEGPRALPLRSGLYTLQHAQTGDVAVYLEPVGHGEHITYAAHFSLLS